MEILNEGKIHSVLEIYDRHAMRKEQALGLLFITEKEEIDKKQWDNLSEEAKIFNLTRIYDRDLISKKALLKLTFNLDYIEKHVSTLEDKKENNCPYLKDDGGCSRSWPNSCNGC